MDLRFDIRGHGHFDGCGVKFVGFDDWRDGALCLNHLFVEHRLSLDITRILADASPIIPFVEMIGLRLSPETSLMSSIYFGGATMN